MIVKDVAYRRTGHPRHPAFLLLVVPSLITQVSWTIHNVNSSPPTHVFHRMYLALFTTRSNLIQVPKWASVLLPSAGAFASDDDTPDVNQVRICSPPPSGFMLLIPKGKGQAQKEDEEEGREGEGGQSGTEARSCNDNLNSTRCLSVFSSSSYCYGGAFHVMHKHQVDLTCFLLALSSKASRTLFPVTTSNTSPCGGELF